MVIVVGSNMFRNALDQNFSSNINSLANIVLVSCPFFASPIVIYWNCLNYSDLKIMFSLCMTRVQSHRQSSPIFLSRLFSQISRSIIFSLSVLQTPHFLWLSVEHHQLQFNKVSNLNYDFTVLVFCELEVELHCIALSEHER